jgi:hypothetical protein
MHTELLLVYNYNTQQGIQTLISLYIKSTTLAKVINESGNDKILLKKWSSFVEQSV